MTPESKSAKSRQLKGCPFRLGPAGKGDSSVSPRWQPGGGKQTSFPLFLRQLCRAAPSRAAPAYPRVFPLPGAGQELLGGRMGQDGGNHWGGREQTFLQQSGAVLLDITVSLSSAPSRSRPWEAAIHRRRCILPKTLLPRLPRGTSSSWQEKTSQKHRPHGLCPWGFLHQYFKPCILIRLICWSFSGR